MSGTGDRPPPLGAVFDARDLRPVRLWLAQAPGELAVTDGGIEETRETHYDTPDGRFQRAGLTLRVRTAGGVLSSLARPADGARLEAAESAVSADSAEALRDCPGPVGDRVRALSGDSSLARRFTLRSRRQSFRVAREGAAFAEVVLDEVTIPLNASDGTAGVGSSEGRGEPVRLNRVEVHGTGTEPESVAAWVDSLREAFGLQPAEPSRSSAALLALGLALPPPPELGPTDLHGDLSTAQTAFAVLRRQFATCLAHDPGTRLGEDIEELHDMRVAIRRMRAAIQLYEAYLPSRLLALRGELAWLGRALGEVRDLDVQLEQLDTWRDELTENDRPALDALTAIVVKQRVAARRRMLRALGSRRFERLVQRVTATLEHGPARTSRVGRTPILAAAPELIAGRFARVAKPGAKIGKRSPEERYHRLRIRCKALRYALEFHRSLYGKKAEAMIRRLVALQDLLGDHQDAAVASSSLRGIVASQGRRLPPETLFVIGILSERYARRARELRSGYPRAFERVRGKSWKRLARAMEALRPVPAAKATRVRAVAAAPPQNDNDDNKDGST